VSKVLANLFSLILIAALTACTAQNQVLLPPPGSNPSQHVFVSDFLTPGTIHIFGPTPLSGSSTQSGSFSGFENPGGMKFDSSNRLYVANFGNSNAAVARRIQVFTQPIANGATASFSIICGGKPEDVAIDSSGNLYVAEPLADVIEVFNAPLSGASPLAFSITNGAGDARGLAFDASGRLFVYGGSGIQVYNAPFSSGSAPAFTLTAVGLNDHGIAFDASGNLFAVGGSGTVNVYLAPFSNGQSPAFSFSATPTTSNDYLAFDRANNLYVPGEDGNVYVTMPPYSAGSTPAFHFAVPGGLSIPGVAVGP